MPISNLLRELEYLLKAIPICTYVVTTKDPSLWHLIPLGKSATNTSHSDITLSTMKLLLVQFRSSTSKDSKILSTYSPRTEVTSSLKNLDLTFYESHVPSSHHLSNLPCCVLVQYHYQSHTMLLARGSIKYSAIKLQF